MLNEEYNKIIAEIEMLPSGGITYKKINGKAYAYYQWREDGKQYSRRTKDEELETLSKQIERRKELQALIKEQEGRVVNGFQISYPFRCSIRIGQELERFVEPVAGWKKRECFWQLQDYVYGDSYDRVYILYALYLIDINRATERKKIQK